MNVETRFAKVAERLLGADRRVKRGRMLQAVGLKTAGKFFAFTTKGELVAKFPAARVQQLIAEGVGQPCEPRKGRPMREWVRLTPADEDTCAAYVIEAHEFVAARTKLHAGTQALGGMRRSISRSQSPSREVGRHPRPRQAIDSRS